MACHAAKGGGGRGGGSGLLHVGSAVGDGSGRGGEVLVVVGCWIKTTAVCGRGYLQRGGE